MNQPAPSTNLQGQKDETLDFDSFTLSEADAAAAESAANKFIDAQPEIEAVNTCESGACSI